MFDKNTLFGSAILGSAAGLVMLLMWSQMDAKTEVTAAKHALGTATVERSYAIAVGDSDMRTQAEADIVAARARYAEKSAVADKRDASVDAQRDVLIASEQERIKEASGGKTDLAAAAASAVAASKPASVDDAMARINGSK